MTASGDDNDDDDDDGIYFTPPVGAVRPWPIEYKPGRFTGTFPRNGISPVIARTAASSAAGVVSYVTM